MSSSTLGCDFVISLLAVKSESVFKDEGNQKKILIKFYIYSYLRFVSFNMGRRLIFHAFPLHSNCLNFQADPC